MKPDTSRFHVIVVLLAIVTTTGLGLTPWGLQLEEEIGLSWLFHSRGERPPPDNILVIAMDKYSANRLGLSNEPGSWPRQLHADLLTKLMPAKPRVIGFDILFRQTQSTAQDQALARAIHQAGNVVLFEYLKKDVIDNEATARLLNTLVIEKRIPPAELFAEQATAVAPFPLPTVPVKVSQYWKYALGAGDAPTLPGVALQLSLLEVYPQFLQLLRTVRPDLLAALPPNETELKHQVGIIEFMQTLRRIYLQQPALAEQLLARLSHSSVASEIKQPLRIFIQLHAGPSSEYLNYYGPPRSIKTLSYFDALQLLDNGDYDSFAGKIIFIGSSEAHQWEQNDGFYSVFSLDNGLDVSGVEIAATAIANQIEDLAIRPITPLSHILLLMAWCLGLLLVSRRLSPIGSLTMVAILSLGYFVVSSLIFSATARWLPVITPLLLQAPLILLLDLSTKASMARRQRENIMRAFGYYLPAAQIERLAKGRTSPQAASQTVFGICLFTDAAQYTHLAEHLPPEQLTALINQYYARLFEPVERYGGFVSDIKGDAMLAVWTAQQPNMQIKQAACDAAVAICQAIDEFNRQQSKQLPTRIGVHCGEIALGHVGAGSHYEYRAVGDIVNTASRIENLNKLLGTRLLVSADLLRGLNNPCHREVGRFRLAGKTQPVTVHELLESETLPDQQHHLQRFAAALQAYYQRQWQTAADIFSELAFPAAAGVTSRTAAVALQDPVAHYYLRLCQQHLQMPPQEQWNGIITLDEK